MAEQSITKEYLLSIFRVDVKRGKMWWTRPPKNHNEKIGMEAGGPSKSVKTYWVISINGRKYKRGALIFLVAHGFLPKPCTDHKNGNSLDDRIENLRPATQLQNNWNRKSGKPGKILPMGVRLIPSSGNFGARIGFRGQQIHLGGFATVEAAHHAYLQKRQELYGEFA